MDTIALLRSHLDRLHGSLDSSIRDLSPEELHWKPSNGCNHIGFSLWHYVRTEDNLISFVYRIESRQCGLRMVGMNISIWIGYLKVRA